jgi:hypothetical protein
MEEIIRSNFIDHFDNQLFLVDKNIRYKYKVQNIFVRDSIKNHEYVLHKSYVKTQDLPTQDFNVLLYGQYFFKHYPTLILSIPKCAILHIFNKQPKKAIRICAKASYFIPFYHEYFLPTTNEKEHYHPEAILSYLLNNERQYLLKNDFKYLDSEDKHIITSEEIEERFHKLKNKLTFDEKTHFYYVLLNPNEPKIKAFCEHKYMLLTNEPYNKILLKCLQNGVCKFCGEVLLMFESLSTEHIDSAHYIYKFLDCLRNSPSSFLFNQLSKFVASIINKQDPQAHAQITLLVLLELYQLTKKQMDYYMNRINRFLKSELKKYILNIDSSIVENIQEEVKSNNDFINYFIGVVKSPKLVDKSLFPPSILNFTEEQKIYPSYKYKFIGNFEDFTKKYNLLMHIILISSFSSNEENIKNFFLNNCIYYCPVNLAHSYGKTENCIFCGLKKGETSNVEYLNKYKNAFRFGRETKRNILGIEVDISKKISNDNKLKEEIKELKLTNLTALSSLDHRSEGKPVNWRSETLIVDTINSFLNLSVNEENIDFINKNLEKCLQFISEKNNMEEFLNLFNYNINKKTLNIVQLSKIIH